MIYKVVFFLLAAILLLPNDVAAVRGSLFRTGRSIASRDLSARHLSSFYGRPTGDGDVYLYGLAREPAPGFDI